MTERGIIMSGDNPNLILSDRNKSDSEIAAQLGCSVSTVKRNRKRLGLIKARGPRKGQGAGDKNPRWKGGRRIRVDGYVLLWTHEGDRLEHQLVMERHLGRALNEIEVVHHINGDKEDNRIENLRLMTQADHMREHRAEMQVAKNAKFKSA